MTGGRAEGAYEGKSEGDENAGDVGRFVQLAARLTAEDLVTDWWSRFGEVHSSGSSKASVGILHVELRQPRP